MHASPKKRVTVAVAQVSSVGFDAEATLAKLGTYAREAAEKGAELVLFPEAFVGTYPRGLSFGATIGNRTIDGRNDFVRYFDNAITVPGPATKFISDIAAANHLYIVTGVIERDGRTLYCTALFFGPDGDLLGKHRKLMPTASERLIWGYGDGSTMPVFDTPIGKMGAAICWENYMPLMRMAYYAKGIELYLAPTADGRETWLPTMRHIAIEGRCFVLSCNQFSRRRDYPDDYNIATTDPDTILNTGGSCIISPMGEVLAGPNFEDECVLTAELDMQDIARGKFDFDVVGHYARPDVFSLTVSERALPPVVIKADSGQAGNDTQKNSAAAQTSS